VMKSTPISIWKYIDSNTSPTCKIKNKTTFTKSLEHTHCQLYNKNHTPCDPSKGQNITMLHIQVMLYIHQFYKHFHNMWFTMVPMLNYFKRPPISYLMRPMGFHPIGDFLIELLHWLVPSHALGLSLGVALDGASNMWISNVHLWCNFGNGFYSSRLSWPSLSLDVETDPYFVSPSWST